jgi:hypothetical protein
MTVKNATEFVVHCENTLGWVPDETKELWKARSIQAGRLNKAIKTKPHLYTWANLELAVEYLRRKRQPIKSPMFVLYVVEDALRLASQESARPLADLIDEAIRLERAQPALTSDSWVGQLTRAVGTYRPDAYDEWKAERGHLFGVTS